MFRLYTCSVVPESKCVEPLRFDNELKPDLASVRVYHRVLGKIAYHGSEQGSIALDMAVKRNVVGKLHPIERARHFKVVCYVEHNLVEVHIGHGSENDSGVP